MDNHISAYRLFDDYGSHPYRCRVNGALLLTKKGTTRKFATLARPSRLARLSLIN